MVKSQIADTVQKDTWCSSVVATWSLSDVTAVVNTGPLVVGLSHSSYSLAEVEEWLEKLDQWDSGDLVAREISGRKCKVVGVFQTPEGVAFANTLNDGRVVKTKLNWLFEEGQTVSVWAYNSGGVAFATSNPDLKVIGHANLWPK